jgi:hypothetical protein
MDEGTRTAPPTSPDDVQPLVLEPTATERLIPARNVPALLAWYFGVFALIPVLGIPSGVVAIVLGIIGIVNARKPDVAVGFWHAVAGISLGILGPAFWIGLALLAAA